MRLILVGFTALTIAASLPAAAPPDATVHAVHRGLARLRQGAARYVQHRQCFSCHHQALTVAALVAARDRGLAVPAPELTAQLEFTLDSFRSRQPQLRKGQGVPGGNTMTAYALFTLQTADHPADDTSAALLDYLLVRQRDDGSWPALMPRPPSEGSAITNAALALAALRHYGPKEPGERRAKVARAAERGRAWLLLARPKDTEDRTFLLRALAAPDGDPRRAASVQADLLAGQHADGSWGQLPGRAGDAYATATVLLALRQAGVGPEEPPIRRGLDYLLRTQRPDGAWLVATRSRPVQTFFDNGDPGGKDQFISFLATGWATRALLERLPRR